MAGSKKKVQFLETPSQVLSNTWFGDTMTAEPCYALKTRALRNVDEQPSEIRYVDRVPKHEKNCVPQTV